LWAHQATRELRYVRVTHEIVDQHAEYLASGRGLIIGDFNSNTIWDASHPGRNHSMLVDKLNRLGLDSIFHRQEGTAHGSELGRRDRAEDLTFPIRGWHPSGAVPAGPSQSSVVFSRGEGMILANAFFAL
jgi:hypothetical protein